MGKNREEERRVGSDGVLIATPAQTTSTDRGTIETRVAGRFGNVAQCLVFFVVGLLLTARCRLSGREGFVQRHPHSTLTPFIPLVGCKSWHPRICDLAEHAPGDRAIPNPGVASRARSIPVCFGAPFRCQRIYSCVATASCLPAFV